MKWTAYVGPKAINLGRFDEKRDVLRAAWFSTEEGRYFFLIGRDGDRRRLSIYRRSDKACIFTTNQWTLGHETSIAEDMI